MIKNKLDILGAHSIPNDHICNNTNNFDRYLSKEQIEALSNYDGLISFTNGAKIKPTLSTTQKSICDKNGYISIGFLYGLGNDEYGIAYNTRKQTQASHELDEFLIIGESSGGDKICLSKKMVGFIFGIMNQRALMTYCILFPLTFQVLLTILKMILKLKMITKEKNHMG